MRYYKVICTNCKKKQQLSTNALSQETCEFCCAQGSLQEVNKNDHF